MTKRIWLVLSAVCLLLTACGKTETVEEDPLDYVYRTVRLTPPSEEYGFPATADVTWEDGRFLVTAQKQDADGYFWADTARTYAFTPADPTLTELAVPQATDAAPSRQDQRFPLSDGGTLVTEVVRRNDADVLELVLLAADGTEKFRLDLASPFGYDYNRRFDGIGVFRLTHVVEADTAAGVRYLLLTTLGPCGLDDVGQICWQDDERYPIALLDTAFGVLYLYGEPNDRRLRPVDPLTGELGEDIPLPGVLTGTGNLFVTGAGYDLYLKNTLALWGLRFVKDEDGAVQCVPEKVIDWAVSALTPAEITDIAVADAESMAVLRRDLLGDTAETELLLLTHVPREQVMEKQPITLAMVWDGDGIARAVADFNRESETHRIVVRDYTRYDGEVRKSFFDGDLAAGKVPDMVVFDNRNGEVDGYERNGLFADLTTLFAADEMLSRELLGYVTRPYQRADGCQYVFPLMPYYDILWGDASVFDGPASVEDMLALYDTRSPAEMAAYDIFLRQGMFLRFADTGTGECRFDDPLFLQGLERILSCQNEKTWQGEKLLGYLWLRDGLYGWALHHLQYGDTMVPVGLPVDGERLVTTDSYDFFGITAVSPYKEECIDFLKGFLSTRGARIDSFFTRSQVYDEIAEYADISICLTPDGPKMIEDRWLTDPLTHELLLEQNPQLLAGITEVGYKLTEADAASFIAFLDDIDGVLSQSTGLYDIYREECLLAEDRTAAEIAAAVQSRASVYMAEVYG